MFGLGPSRGNNRSLNAPLSAVVSRGKALMSHWVSSYARRFSGEFFQGFANHAPATLHIDNLCGNNAHHIAETVFKAFGRALRVAVSRDERMAGVIPSTKGSL